MAVFFSHNRSKDNLNPVLCVTVMLFLFTWSNQVQPNFRNPGLTSVLPWPLKKKDLFWFTSLFPFFPFLSSFLHHWKSVLIC